VGWVVGSLGWCVACLSWCVQPSKAGIALDSQIDKTMLKKLWKHIFTITTENPDPQEVDYLVNKSTEL
jgi:putative heme degradation protein